MIRLQDVEVYYKLLDNITRKITDMKLMVTEIFKLMQDIKLGQGRESDLMALAAYFHHFYTAIENMLEQILQIFDNGVVTGANYAQDLLRTMALSVPEIRPAVINMATVGELEEYRYFRDSFRENFDSKVQWRKIEPLAERVPALTEMIEEGLKSFVSFVEELSLKDINKEQITEPKP